MNRKFNTTLTAALVLLGILGTGRLNAQKHPISWSSMEDIRQVTKLASYTQWETIREEKGVKLSSRWLTFGDSVKTREMAAHFVVDADFRDVLECLMNPEKMMEWNDGVRSLDVFQQDGLTWITHTVYDIPYPLSQQDLVVKNVMIRDKQKVTILLSAIPGYIEPLKNVTRQQLYFGKWELKTLENSDTEVRFSVVSFSKSGIPRFMRDPVIQNKLFNSFIRLKELSAVKSLEEDRDLQTSNSYM